MFVNVSNHPVALWSPEQRTAAEALGHGPAADLPGGFPAVEPELDAEAVDALAESTVEQIVALQPKAAFVAGDFSLTAALVPRLQARGLPCYCSTSLRQTSEQRQPDGTTLKRAVFRFVRWRRYGEWVGGPVRGKPVECPERQPGGRTEEAASPRHGASTPPQPEPVNRAPQRDVKRPRAQDLLRAVEKAASWYGAQSQQAQRARAAYLEHPEGRSELADQAAARGEESTRLLDELYACSARSGAGDPAVERRLAQFCEKFPYLADKGRRQVQAGGAAGRRRREERAAARSRGPLSGVKVGPDAPSHRLQDQPPQSAWLLLVDETGNQFQAPLPSRARAQERGRLVGLLVPNPAPGGLKDRRDFHAADATNAQIDAVVQETLAAPVGILGLTVADLPPQRGDRWAAGVLHLLHWVLRLLPLPASGAVRVLVRVEQRGGHQQGAVWDAAVREVLRSLCERDPVRYGRMEVDLRVLGKGGHPHAGHVDALAYTWGSPSRSSRARLKQSCLLGPCLHDGDGERMLSAWDRHAAGLRLAGEDWRALVLDPGALVPASIPGVLLAQLGDACRRDPDLWAHYLETTREHMDSKAVRLGVLGREVAWLAQWGPPGARVSPRLRLAWATARLEADNHLGRTNPALLAELRELGDALFEEAPTLVCQAELDRAVLHTNRFEFDLARQALDRWSGLPPYAAGLQHWGRVQSSLGQHAAFAGASANAREQFDAALAAFGRLSDPVAARGEQAQTRNYLAVAALDDPSLGPEKRREAVSAVVALDPESIGRMAADNEPADKYAHHLLVRYLVQEGRPAERDAYAAQREQWRQGNGHPWPLTLLYRALLLHQRGDPGVEDLLVDAWSLAMAPEHGPTLRLIGATIDGVARCLGVVDGQPQKDALDRLQRELPAAAERIERLRAPARGGVAEALELLAAVLPFNFR